jgi:hypothetical protein
MVLKVLLSSSDDFFNLNFVDKGHFWVFTDSHIDLFYQSSNDASIHCHNISLNNITKIIRKFGQFDCDTPIELLQSSFSAANRIDSNVDFIIWLGYRSLLLINSI